MVRSLVEARDYLSLKCPDQFWSCTQPHIQWVLWILSGGLSGEGVKMTCCSLLPRLRMSGDTYLTIFCLDGVHRDMFTEAVTCKSHIHHRTPFTVTSVNK